MSKVTGTEEFERAGNKVHDVLGSIQENLLSCPITHSRLQRQRQRNMRKKRRSPLHRSALEQAWLALLAVSSAFMAGTIGFILRVGAQSPKQVHEAKCPISLYSFGRPGYLCPGLLC